MAVEPIRWFVLPSIPVFGVDGKL